MGINKRFLAGLVGAALIIGGCSHFASGKDEVVKDADSRSGLEAGGEEEDLTSSNTNSDKQNGYEKENFVRVQDYTGEGYELRDANQEIQKTARAASEEIEDAVSAFFMKKYKTEITVMNIVGARDAATVYVESVADPHFYTYAIVPYDFSTGTMRTDDVWTQEGQVEIALYGWLYAKAYPEQFTKLNQFLEGFVNSNPVTGLTAEAVSKVKGSGFSNVYYLVSPFGPAFEDALKLYLKNPQVSGEQIRQVLEKTGYDAKHVSFGITLYMEEEAAPDPDIIKSLSSGVNELTGIPIGAYSLNLNDNYIDKRRASGNKENSIDLTWPDEIIKE
ncbi:hypothetical protein AV656_07975 [Bhargavaea cecembensis]|uniref:DUF1672 domain-containing protein n=1 Tax=Bhargavaea cecembensis TaxID=394098 RepID=A0A163FJU5_9BACL|nr:DUF1672 family protein [Bhargavaea cecembensis]KZE38831.1 hypothetical protein AV656_07975 [Bhargavaea cecembensis]